ncbi:MAG: hypothetical protein JEZ12_13005 [Desulfobacterium sp.]|nr:hypothetical protein [Desulfobacterium sp.]
MKRILVVGLVVACMICQGCMGVAVDLGADGLNVRFKAVTPDLFKGHGIEIVQEGHD